jgi:hypothetical protein
MKRAHFLAVALSLTPLPVVAGTRHETPDQVRRIVAQSLCLATAYPNSDISRDNEAIYAVYAPLLNVKAPLEARRIVETLATKAQPASPTPVGDHNLALAKCVLFAEQPNVQSALGAKSAKRRRSAPKE